MVNEVLLETLREIVGEQAVRRDVPMSGLTTFQIGGPAAVVVEPASVQEAADVLAACHSAGQPVRLLGLGSDLLVADAGLPEVIVRFAERFSDVVVEGSRVTVQAGASNAQVAEAACAAALAGYEFASGIPGTIGGAAIMNAGAYGGEIRAVCRWSQEMLPDGTLVRREGVSQGFGYRTSVFQHTDGVIVRACFALQPGDPGIIRETMRELMTRRTASQPLDLPSAGSAFKRPQGGYAAALIESAGLKGLTVGGAQVSEKHAGFVVNRGGATAADVLELLRQVQQRVLEHSGIRLEPEIRLWD